MQNNLPVTLFLSQNALFSGRIPPHPMLDILKALFQQF